MLRLLTRPAVRAVRPAVLRRMAPRAVAAVVAPRRWMAGGGHAAPAAHDSHGHAAAGSYGGGHGHGSGPTWAAATEHERLNREAEDLRKELRDEYTLAGQEGLPVSTEEPSEEEMKRVRDHIAQLPKEEGDEDDVEFVMEKCADGIERPDFVPCNEPITRTIQMDGETIVVPELHATLDWVMSSPMDFHTFEEVPAIKEAPEHDHHEDNTKDE